MKTTPFFKAALPVTMLSALALFLVMCQKENSNEIPTSVDLPNHVEVLFDDAAAGSSNTVIVGVENGATPSLERLAAFRQQLGNAGENTATMIARAANARKGLDLSSSEFAEVIRVAKARYGDQIQVVFQSTTPGQDVAIYGVESTKRQGSRYLSLEEEIDDPKPVGCEGACSKVNSVTGSLEAGSIVYQGTCDPAVIDAAIDAYVAANSNCTETMANYNVSCPDGCTCRYTGDTDVKELCQKRPAGSYPIGSPPNQCTIVWTGDLKVYRHSNVSSGICVPKKTKAEGEVIGQ